ncbi:MAG TPA: 50S ribosomal protein L32 [Candidatus Saccharimonadales bacterium]|nr:50S ribosomal protein L32 [Candidatus Saccharimonadales bacterium]
MALPKRRHSRTRGRKRRTHWVLSAPAVVPCSHCSQPKRPHRVCPNCGYYDGEEIQEPKNA